MTKNRINIILGLGFFLFIGKMNAHSLQNNLHYDLVTFGESTILKEDFCKFSAQLLHGNLDGTYVCKFKRPNVRKLRGHGVYAKNISNSLSVKLYSFECG